MSPAETTPNDLTDRFWSKVDKSGDCWVWTGGASGGYGKFWMDGKSARAHRVAYVALVGPVPVGLDLDHLCRNRRCVKPDHLEPVTLAENNQRAAVVRDTCRHDHPLDGIRIHKSGRVQRFCKTCRNASAAAARGKRKEKAA